MMDTAPAPKLAPKLALVTGASRGLGFAMAERLGASGWHVLAVARTTGALEELDDKVQAKGGACTIAPLDITDEGAMGHLAQQILARWGKLDLWVHAAIQAAPLAPAAHTDPKELDRSTACNIRATAQLIPLLTPLLLAAKGSAMFFDDPRAGAKFFGVYGATKSAQIALARSWQAESATTGPRVLIETPAPMPTATRARFFPGEDRAALTPPGQEADRLLALI